MDHRLYRRSNKDRVKADDSNLFLTQFCHISKSRSHDQLMSMRTNPPTCFIRMESEESFTTVKSCEYKALKECLDKNQGRKEKCEKEWIEFQTLCANNKK